MLVSDNMHNEHVSCTLVSTYIYIYIYNYMYMLYAEYICDTFSNCICIKLNQTLSIWLSLSLYIYICIWLYITYMILYPICTYELLTRIISIRFTLDYCFMQVHSEVDKLLWVCMLLCICICMNSQVWNDVLLWICIYIYI